MFTSTCSESENECATTKYSKFHCWLEFEQVPSRWKENCSILVKAFLKSYFQMKHKKKIISSNLISWKSFSFVGRIWLSVITFWPIITFKLHPFEHTNKIFGIHAMSLSTHRLSLWSYKISLRFLILASMGVSWLLIFHRREFVAHAILLPNSGTVSEQKCT